MSAVSAPACTGAVLFTDLVGFTEFNEVVGDANAVDVLTVIGALNFFWLALR